MEQARLKEFFKYFRAASHATNLIYEDIDSPENYRSNEAFQSTDLVLNALVQLVVRKLNADRAFVSLIDDEYQYVIVEETKTISLVDGSLHKENDELCIGTKPLSLDAGICAGTMHAFTGDTTNRGPIIRTTNIYADSSRYTINDLTLEDLYKERPYVTGHPNMRWYAEVPLRTASGYAIGSLAVVDSTPRAGLKDSEYRIMSELASAVMKHLEMLRIDLEHSRAVNLLNGLDKFMRQRPSLPLISRKDRALPTPLENAKKIVGDGPVSPGPTAPATIAEPSATSRSIDQSVQSSHTPRSSSSQRSPQTSFTDISSAHETHQTQPSLPDPDVLPQASVDLKKDTHPHNVEIPKTYQERRMAIFSTASSLLREAANLDGVVFFDATPIELSSYPVLPAFSNSHTLNELEIPATKDNDSSIEPENTSIQGRDEQQSRQRSCKQLGGAFRKSTNISDDGDSRGELLLPVSVLRSLLHHLPKGVVFTSERNREPDTSNCNPDERYRAFCLSHIMSVGPSSSEVVDPLGKWSAENALWDFLPASCSIIFHPLWNSQTENWYAACLAWSNDSKSNLQSSDLSYISAFSNSIMAEVVNLELLAIDNAKSDFISSISHEVRSPLHGILGSAEILADVIVDKEQQGLVQIVENCGRNLLETMDDILHYSKINSKARLVTNPESERNESGQSTRTPHMLTDVSDFDVGRFVETTVESLLVGHQNATSRSSAIYHQRNVTPNETARELVLDTPANVMVILRVAHRTSWTVTSRRAVWQRILTNLLGNAMKYTSIGYIEVDLFASPQNEGFKDSVVTLTVRDTGKGISQSYLHHHLYQPFVQEDTLSPGTGLGLSIVKGLVDEIHGDISIRSTKGVGTEVAVNIPVTFVENVARTRLSFPNHALCLLGFDACSQLGITPTGEEPIKVRRELALKNNLTKACEEWLQTILNCSNHGSEVNSNIIAIMEDDVHLFKKSPSAPGLESLDVPENSVLILLCVNHTTKEKLHNHENIPGVYYLSQPFGPLQLIDVMTLVQNFMNQTRSSKRQKPNPRQYVPSRPIPHNLDMAQTETTESDNTLAGKHVLLVEDNSVNLQLLVRSMQKIGRKILTATDGQQAVELYRSRSGEIDHVLMDVSMPVMDGFEATREIRAIERQQGQPRTPITMITGLGSEVAQKEAEVCGSDRFLVKPVKLAILKSLLDR